MRQIAGRHVSTRGEPLREGERSMARITSIELTSGEPGMAPKVVAILKRVPGVRYIDIEILHDDGRRKQHHVVAASEDDRWSMAACLTATFMGDRGGLADTHEFNRLLGLLAG
jgi:hypothetical protein